jgi:hypothetical protein
VRLGFKNGTTNFRCAYKFKDNFCCVQCMQLLFVGMTNGNVIRLLCCVIVAFSHVFSRRRPVKLRSDDADDTGNTNNKRTNCSTEETAADIQMVGCGTGSLLRQCICLTKHVKLQSKLESGRSGFASVSQFMRRVRKAFSGPLQHSLFA